MKRYVWGFAKKKVTAREVNKKERCKMVKRDKRVVSYEKRVVQQEWVKWIFSEESQVVIVNNMVYMWRKVDKFNHQLACPASRRRLSVMISRCVCVCVVIGTLADVQSNNNAQEHLLII